MDSIRGRLFAILLLSTGMVWLSAVGWIYWGTHSKVERVLDRRLMEAARMVDSLITSREVALDVAAATAPRAAAALDITEHTPIDRQLACQIWSFRGALLANSDSAPVARLGNHASGFGEETIDGQVWRVYAVENKALGVRVLVGDNLAVRDRLVSDVVTGLLLPAAAIIPILAALIWYCVGRGMQPIREVAQALGNRNADDLSPLPDAPSALEIRPMIEALNGLFRRVAGVRERERNFTSFAAHELRTPLAGLKTQVQVALSASDPALQKAALQQILNGVDRTSRLISQLLDMARVESPNSYSALQWINAGELFSAMTRDLSLLAKGHNVTVACEPSLNCLEILSDRHLLSVNLRNLLENAILYSPNGGIVACGQHVVAECVVLTVSDEGPGIAEDEVSRVTERFYRGRHRSTVGSGLGLSIVEAALSHSGGALKLKNKHPHGLVAEISLSAQYRTSSTNSCAIPPAGQSPGRVPPLHQR